MRFIKLLLISVFALLLVVTIISLLFPADVRVSKAIDLDHPRDSVIRLLTDTSQWKRWHPSFMTGSAYRSNYEAVYKLRTATDSLVVMDVDLKKRTLVYGWQFYHYPQKERYTLQWWADFHSGWNPLERFGSLFYEKTYGAMMEQGLKNIDSVLSQSGPR
jgi:hypothetical protein